MPPWPTPSWTAWSITPTGSNSKASRMRKTQDQPQREPELLRIEPAAGRPRGVRPQTRPPPMGPRRYAASRDWRLGSSRLAAALPHWGMAWSAGLGQRRKRSPNRASTSPSAPKSQARQRRKNLTQFGHPRKSHCRASLRSDNCPNTSDHCPTIFGMGVRIHRNPHSTGKRPNRNAVANPAWAPNARLDLTYRVHSHGQPLAYSLPFLDRVSIRNGDHAVVKLALGPRTESLGGVTAPAGATDSRSQSGEAALPVRRSVRSPAASSGWRLPLSGPLSAPKCLANVWRLLDNDSDERCTGVQSDPWRLERICRSAAEPQPKRRGHSYTSGAGGRAGRRGAVSAVPSQGIERHVEIGAASRVEQSFHSGLGGDAFAGRQAGVLGRLALAHPLDDHHAAAGQQVGLATSSRARGAHLAPARL